MAIARKHLVDPNHRLFYNLNTRCVRRSFLCGKDPLTGKDFSHRKKWLIDKIHELTPAFSISVEAYTIMSNHFHLVVDYDPNACKKWSQAEVIRRWLIACPQKKNGKPDPGEQEKKRLQLANDPVELERVRGELGSLSTFMKFLKQSFAERANKEDGCTGHFFEQRFWSSAILDEEGLIDSMAYVDLNPIRAKIAKTIEECKHSSIRERLNAIATNAETLAQHLKPIVTGLETDESTHSYRVLLSSYIDHLKVLIRAEQLPGLDASLTDQEALWVSRTQILKRKQRVYGPKKLIQLWLDKRNMRHLEVAFDQ